MMSLFLPSGQLIHPITIQENYVTADGYGGSTKSWATFANSRAAIWPQKSQEVVIDGKLTTVSRVVMRIRWIAGITTKMRVLKTADSKIFEILGTKNIDERNRTIELYCRENE